MLSSWVMRSRSASVARTVPGAAWARTPMCSAVALYQTRISVLSCAATPSLGKNCEKPVSRAAFCHTASVSCPSTVRSDWARGGSTRTWPRLPS